MMEESLFLAAFVAGVAEGSEVLSYYRSLSKNNVNNNKSTTTSSPSLFIPSIMYGSMAMPMSIIGESPGPALLAYIPSVRKILPPLSPSAFSETTPTRTIPRVQEQPPLPPPPEENNVATALAADTSSSASRSAIIGNKTKKVTMIDLARKGNRSARSQQQGLSSVPAKSGAAAAVTSNNISNPQSSSTSWMTTRYTATLDSRNPLLPTPRAELLRRMRLLCFGAGLVTTYVSYQFPSFNAEKDSMIPFQQSDQNTILNPVKRWIQYAKTTMNLQSNHNDKHLGKGIALRFVLNNHNHANNSRSVRLYEDHGRLPVLLSSSSSSHHSSSSSGGGPVLNIENFDKYCNTESWLHRYSSDNPLNKKNGQPFWLIEMDLSPSLKDLFRFPKSPLSSKDNNGDTDSVLFAIDHIAMTSQNAISGTPDVIVTALYAPSSSGNIDQASLIEDDSNYNIIYLDILKELACKIDQSLGSLYRFPEQVTRHEKTIVDTEDSAAILKSSNERNGETDKIMVTTESTTEMEEIDPSNTGEDKATDEGKSKDLFQWIGVGIRYSFASLVTLFRIPRKQKEGKRIPLYVVTDNADFVRWVGEVLVEYRVVHWSTPHDVAALKEVGIPYLVCCFKDETASKAIQQIFKNDKESKAVVIMDRIFTQNHTRRRLNELSINANTRVDIMSMEKLRMDTFKRIQGMLVSGE